MAYHHGDLTTALVEAAVALGREGGPAAITIREATRRTGVSPNAAYRHFPSRAALLDAAAAAIQQGLAAAMTDAPERSPVERLHRIGAAYIDFALDEPGWFGVVFFGIRPPEPATMAQSPAFRALTAALDDLVAAGALPEAQRDDAAWACWATVHGFAELCLRGPLAGLDRAEQNRRGDAAIRAVIAGIQVDAG
jgi:AcrR family transcriptional regulator